MLNEQETLKYLSAMGIIDFNKLGFVYGKETITEVLNLVEKKNKIIDEMANNILEFRADTILPTDTEGIKQYFERKVEE